MILIDNTKDKMIHAMIYFVKNTKHCYKVKLFKLLYLLDFEHFRQTGRSVTGLNYEAWDMGPVPKYLYEMIDTHQMREQIEMTENNNLDLSKVFSIDTVKINKDMIRTEFKPRVSFNEKLFSIREVRIIKEIANSYKEKKSKDMTEITHNKQGLWYKTYCRKKYDSIDYLTILNIKKHEPDTISIEEAQERQNDDAQIKKMFG